MQALYFYPDKQQVPTDIKELKRYLGYKKDSEIDANTEKMIERAADTMKDAIVPKACYKEFDLSVDGERISFADLDFTSKNLSVNLKNCTKVVLFGATVGAKVDQIIRKGQLAGSADAAIFQAAGAMYAESLTELLNQKIRDDYLKNGFKAHPRYSPGYGDISLEMQKDFFRLLPLEKIGLTLMESLIMAPEKSVTAFIGLEKIETE